MTVGGVTDVSLDIWATLIFLAIRKERMDARLSSTQNFLAILRYPKKSRRDFFGSYAAVEPL